MAARSAVSIPLAFDRHANAMVLAVYAIMPYSASLNSRHRKTLAASFTDRAAASIEWPAIESLLIAVGCELVEGSGARVRFVMRGAVATFHRPHPAKESKRYQVRDAREFLIRIGVQP